MIRVKESARLGNHARTFTEISTQGLKSSAWKRLYLKQVYQSIGAVKYTEDRNPGPRIRSREGRKLLKETASQVTIFHVEKNPKILGSGICPALNLRPRRVCFVDKSSHAQQHNTHTHLPQRKCPRDRAPAHKRHNKPTQTTNRGQGASGAAAVEEGGPSPSGTMADNIKVGKPPSRKRVAFLHMH